MQWCVTKRVATRSWHEHLRGEMPPELPTARPSEIIKWPGARGARDAGVARSFYIWSPDKNRVLWLRWQTGCITAARECEWEKETPDQRPKKASDASPFFSPVSRLTVAVLCTFQLINCSRTGKWLPLTLMHRRCYWTHRDIYKICTCICSSTATLLSMSECAQQFALICQFSCVLMKPRAWIWFYDRCINKTRS